MIRGLEEGLRPFIKRIIVEDGFQNLPNNRTQYSEYYNSTVKDSEHSINLTIDFCINCETTNKIIGKITIGRKSGSICVKCFKAYQK